MADETKSKKSKGDATGASSELVKVEESAEDNAPMTLTVAEVNKVTLGELTVHFQSRDVTLVVDGATASRVLRVFARPQRRRALQDVLTEESAMVNVWATLDLHQAIAVSWMPGVPSPIEGRMTFDPPVYHDGSAADERRHRLRSGPLRCCSCLRRCRRCRMLNEGGRPSVGRPPWSAGVG